MPNRPTTRQAAHFYSANLPTSPNFIREKILSMKIVLSTMKILSVENLLTIQYSTLLFTVCRLGKHYQNSNQEGATPTSISEFRPLAKKKAESATSLIYTPSPMQDADAVRRRWKMDLDVWQRGGSSEKPNYSASPGGQPFQRDYPFKRTIDIPEQDIPEEEDSCGQEVP